jgi:hypothetical protein
VVRLHVVDDDIVELGDIDDLVELVEEFIGLKGFGQINEGFFLIIDEVGVIGDSFSGDRPEAFEKIGRPVVHSNPIDIRSNFNWHCSVSPLSEFN